MTRDHYSKEQLGFSHRNKDRVDQSCQPKYDNGQSDVLHAHRRNAQQE